MTHVEMKKKYNADGDDLDLFFSDSEDNTPRCEIEVWRSFCRGMSLYNVERGTGAAGSDKLAWLDERTCGGDLKLEGLGDARCNPNFLTATGLYRALKTRRFNHGTLPDASRRLIYISDLNPASVHALAATASGHQAPVLRKAIYKHWAFKTSIAVKIRPAGFLSFHLDLQLPFFLLRKETPPDEESLGCEKLNTKPKRGWTDLSFLETSDTGISTSETEKQQEKEEEEVWGIREAHISFVVTGTDDWRWAGYGFIDAEIDGVLADSSPDDLLFDPIAARELKANLPIWKPREYWLKVFEVRIGQVRKEWDDLAHKLEHDIDTYVRGRSLLVVFLCGNGYF